MPANARRDSPIIPRTTAKAAQEQQLLAKLTKALDDAHTVRARLGDGGESNGVDPDDIDKLREPTKRLAA
jgi:hypothetical protein